MIGQALRFAIPGSFGMIGKIAFVHNDSKINSLYSFILERIFVTWVLLFFASMALVFVDLGIPSWISWLLFLIFDTMPFWMYFLLSVDRRLKKLQSRYLKLAPAMVFAGNNFNWTSVLNMTHNKNKIVSLDGKLEQSLS